MYRIIVALFRVLVVVIFLNNSICGDIAGRAEVKHEQQTVKCPDYQAQCDSGQTCVDLMLFCDGLKDCPDGSDETEQKCAKNKCSDVNFQCSYGACVHLSTRCDGRADCADNSDETNAHCPPLVPDAAPSETCQWNEFQCIESRNCIEKVMACDGKADCADGSDETVQLCENSTCLNSNFRCEYGACINSSYKCDGTKNCLDGSDEFEVLCKPRYNPPEGHIPPDKNITLNQLDISFDNPSLDNNPLLNEYFATAASCKLLDSALDLQMNITCPKEAPKCVNQTSQTVDHLTEFKHRCSEGYGSGGRTNEFLSICWRGGWLPPITRCKRTCKALKPENVDLTCKLNRYKVDCKGDLLEGTSVRPRCKAYHQATQPIHYRQIYCESDGQWTDQLFTCIPECGKPNKSVKKLITFGETEKYGEAPWYVAIYNVEESGHPLICGGTLISPHLVLSAAHCFFEESVQRLHNVSRYEIAVSKYSRDYSQKDNRFTKMYKIRKILLPNDAYTGFSTNYASDIAILWIKEKIHVNRAVLPACIPWTNVKPFNPGDGIPGKLSGFGKTKNGTDSELLITAQLPYISRDKCIKSLKYDYKDIVTLDKFCAGSKMGASATEGDSGGGLLFQDPKFGVYYLYGIVSIKDESVLSVAIFTDLQPYLDWMDEVRIQVQKQKQ